MLPMQLWIESEGLLGPFIALLPGKGHEFPWLAMGLRWALKLWEERGMSGLHGSGSSQQAPTLPLSTLPTLNPKGRTSKLDWPNCGPKWTPGKPFHRTSREVKRAGISSVERRANQSNFLLAVYNTLSSLPSITAAQHPYLGGMLTHRVGWTTVGWAFFLKENQAIFFLFFFTSPLGPWSFEIFLPHG